MSTFGGGVSVSGSEGQSLVGAGTQTRTVPANSYIRVYGFTVTAFAGGTCILRITSNGQAIDVQTFAALGVVTFPGGLDVGPGSTIQVVNSAANTAQWVGTLFANS